MQNHVLALWSGRAICPHPCWVVNCGTLLSRFLNIRAAWCDIIPLLYCGWDCGNGNRICSSVKGIKVVELPVGMHDTLYMLRICVSRCPFAHKKNILAIWLSPIMLVLVRDNTSCQWIRRNFLCSWWKPCKILEIIWSQFVLLHCMGHDLVFFLHCVNEAILDKGSNILQICSQRSHLRVIVTILTSEVNVILIIPSARLILG